MSREAADFLLWMPVAIISSFGNSIDIFLLLSLGIKRNRRIVEDFVTAHIDIKVVIDIAKISVSCFILLQCLRYIRGLRQPIHRVDAFLAKPMLFPCRTAHTRLFPTKHSFSYSYLLVGIPVGWKGSTGGMISADDLTVGLPWYLRLFSFQSAGAWFTVNGDDYLARGHVGGGLREKLEGYLHTQGEDPRDYPHAYLLTAPRFLNYSSNPVSIWHLYSTSRVLSAVILEVNNTFDERHPYFLKLDNVPSPQSTAHAPVATPDIIKPTRIAHTWPKDFYVSVFNSRGGAYSLSATDPLSSSSSSAPISSLGGSVGVNTTITLSSSKGHPKLVARVFSTAPALDPSAMSVGQKTLFLARWWWVGLATFPRTVKEAVNILCRRGLHWVFRPEPRRNTTPRKADELEAFVEPIFREHLSNAVQRSQVPLVVKYIPAGLLDVSEVLITSPSAQLLGTAGVKEIEIRVLTPIFYSRLVQYSQTIDALTSECFQSATVSVSDAESVGALDFSSHSPPSTLGTVSRIQLSLLQSLRKRPPPIENTETKKLGAKSEWAAGVMVCNSSASELDAFVASQLSTNILRVYYAKLARLFVAERIALGWTDVLDLEIFICRVAAAWFLAGTIDV